METASTRSTHSGDKVSDPKTEESTKNSTEKHEINAKTKTNKDKKDDAKSDISDNDEDAEVMLYEDEDENEEELYGQKKGKPDFSTGAPPGSFDMYSLNWKELEDRRARHHEVIRKILADFDLEAVKEKYRGKGMMHEASHANRKFRMWLEKVMGTDQLQISDKQWHELFRQKVTEDYEHKLKERERQLAEAEVQRIQRLRLQGILTSDTTRETIQRNRNRSKKKSHRAYSDHSLRHQDLYTRPLDDIETQMEIINKTHTTKDKRGTTPDEEKDEEEVNKTNKNDTKNNEMSTKTSKSEKNKENEDSDVLKTNQTHKKQTKGIQKQDDVVEGYGTKSSLDDKETDTAFSDTDSAKNGHLGMSGIVRPHRNPNIHCLYKEENLHQLYAQAEAMIRPSAITSSSK